MLRRTMSEQARPLFDLTLTDEQALMRETARRFAASEMRGNSRKADEAGTAPDGFYARSAELGFAVVPIAEDLGGIGAARSPVSNMLIAEDLAHGDMSLAIGALSGLAFVNTVIDAGTPEQQKALLPPFTEESARSATIAFMEPGLRFDPRKPKTQAKKSASGWVLRGEKTMVPLGGSADVMLVIADAEGVGPSAFILPKGQAGVRAEREQFMGLRPLELCKLGFDDVQLPLSAKLGDGDKPFDLQRFIDLSRIGIGALSLGVGQAVLDYVKPYCNDRIAFGEPITQSPGGRVHDRRHRDRARRHALARISRRIARRARLGFHARGVSRARCSARRRA